MWYNIFMEQRSKFVYDCLKEKFPNAACELEFNSNFQLLISVILSAQCTDKRVNEVTKVLFEKYPTAFDLANAKLEDVIKIVKPCGFFNNKAKNIIATSKTLVEKFNGEVPKDFSALLSLPGVGQKTANVLTSVGFGGDAFAVDTHVFRVAKRLGLANEKTPEKVEEQLKKVFCKNMWSETHHLMVLFGRYYCKARNPQCNDCKLKENCLYYNNLKK